MISTEFEERLREEMRHATTGISAPSGLVRRARRDRRRRIVSRASAASAAVAVAVAVAGAVIVSNGTELDGHGPGMAAATRMTGRRRKTADQSPVL